jgi:hypothetical protein
VDGAGKTHFADEVATELTQRGVPAIRTSVDGFHRTAATGAAAHHRKAGSATRTATRPGSTCCSHR